MYCRACGKQIPDDANFCPYCQSAQSQSGGLGGNNAPPKKKKSILRTILTIILTPLILFGVLFTVLVVIELVKIPENGWYETGGKTYYYVGDGDRSVGYWEIDGDTYFFDQEGVLQKDTISRTDGYQYVTDSQGRVTEIGYDVFYGSWAEEHYMTNRANAPVLEYHGELKNCTSVDFYLEASGRAGTKIDGLWQICFKINGEWKELAELNYSGASKIITIPFDHPVAIEAVTAFPRIYGNYTYDVDFELRNVWCNEP